jgi:hypothetical protein
MIQSNEIEVFIEEEYKQKMIKSLEDIKINRSYKLKCYVCKITKIALCHYSYARDEFVCSKNCLKKYKIDCYSYYCYECDCDHVSVRL